MKIITQPYKKLAKSIIEGHKLHFGSISDFTPNRGLSVYIWGEEVVRKREEEYRKNRESVYHTKETPKQVKVETKPEEKPRTKAPKKLSKLSDAQMLTPVWMLDDLK